MATIGSLVLALLEGKSDLPISGVFGAGKTRSAAILVGGLLVFEPNLNLMILTKENVAAQAFAEHIEGLNMLPGITSKIGRLVGYMELKKNRTKGTSLDVTCENRHDVLRQKKLLIGCGGGFQQECSQSYSPVARWITEVALTLTDAAEAFAFKELLGRSHGPVTLVVDAKYVINKWQKIRNPDNIYEGSNPEIWTQIADHQNREVSLIKIKSHLKREQFEHLHGSDNVWQWWVNFYADDICDQRAADLAPRNHSKVVDWVLGRAWKLNLFLAERVQIILTDGPKLPQEPRKTRRTKQTVFAHAVDTKVGDHAWKHNPKGGVVCTHCGKSIKPYLSLADIEVHLRQACQSLQVPLGIRIHHSHDITAIPGQTGQSCRLCGAVVRRNAKRLMVPCR